MRRHSLVVVMAAAVMAAGLIGPELASSAPTGDPRAERERVRAEQAEVASKLDTTKASKQEIDEAIEVINENLATQEAALARTQEQVAQAKQDIADAEAAIVRLKAEITQLRAEVRRRAVQAYVSPPGDDVLTVLDTNDFVTASSRKFYIELRSQDDADIADRLDGAMAEITYQREKADAARKVAEKKEAEQAKRTDAVRDAKAQKQQIAESLQATIDSQIARSIELQKTDRALAKKIAEEQAALVARLAAAQAAQEEADAAAAAAAAAAARPSGGTQTPSGGESTPVAPITPTGGGTGTGGICLTWVGGIQVNCAIGAQLGNLLSAARGSGVNLSGGGYRDPAEQIALRRAHCGSSYYAIYQAPASSCSPPTARPGTSQHEIGLAIDFDNCGYSSACYNWLRGNASNFGFYNLPGESWHWSTSGS
ncbi:D-alanyl-D-alanine carboxypeptidase family protein [Aquihabitans daechungensis]|uniref:D-alanyl-D-alanine carboxypeptidase family protein n=1 Tax=Aquihabitans daechungensis TaxID=1052257 RepID=UPI003B9DDBBF